MNQIEKFYAYLQELDQSYSRLADLLRQKLAAVSGNDLGKLDEIIKEEQVYVLISKGFDSTLQNHREKLGFHSNTLSEVVEELPHEHRDSFRKLSKHLKVTLDEAKALNQKCQELIEDRLYTLDRSIKALDKSAGATYQKGGDSKTGPKPGSGLFTKSV